MRSVRLGLMEMAATGKLSTGFYLEVKICCDVPERTYYLDVKADFGRRPPRAARLVVLKSRYEATTPVGLIEGGACVERGVPLEIVASTEKVIFWVTTEGSPDVPPKLAAEIRVRPPSAPPAEPTDELDTLRLPSIKNAILESLTRGLVLAPPGPMTALAEILTAPSTATAAQDVDRLIGLGADFRLVEAAVRAIETAEQAGKAGPPIDFAAWSLASPGGAALAVLHPLSPPYLINEAFAGALENHLSLPRTDPTAAFWTQLTKAAAIILCRRGRALLEEDAAAIECGGDGYRPQVIRLLIDWASRKQSLPEPPAAEPLDVTVARMADPDPAVALAALCDALLTYGFIGVSTQLD